MKDYNDLFIPGVEVQQEQMVANKHKGVGYQNSNFYYLQLKINRHYRQIGSLLRTSNINQIIDYKKLRKVAADMANFSHMLIMLCDEKIKELGD